MRAAPAIVLPLLLVACAGMEKAMEWSVVPDFASRRPVMVSLRVEAPEADEEPLFAALYDGLLEKKYSVLAPGLPAGAETGIFRATLTGADAHRTADVVFEDPSGAILYRAGLLAWPGTVKEAAALLLEDLPAK